jgi:cytoskeletal protein RodZ
LTTALWEFCGAESKTLTLGQCGGGGEQLQEAYVMFKKTIGIAFSAIILAGAFGLAGTGAANAESDAKICADKWKAAKAAGTTGDKTRKDFVAECRTEQKAAAPAADTAPASAASPPATAAPAPAPAPTATAPTAPAPTADATAPAKPKRKATTAMPAGPGQFTTDTEAKAKCPSDTVVWVNTKSKKFHYAGSSDYGKTKKGAYMCEMDATAAGAVAAKNEKKP